MTIYGYLNAIPYTIKKQVQELSFRIYVTDTLRVLAEGKNFKEDITRWADMIKEEKKETRSADEIVLDVIKRAGLKTKGEVKMKNESI